MNDSEPPPTHRSKPFRDSPIFATTRWSVLLAARAGGERGAEEALETLCRTYWFPLYSYLRRQGHDPGDAQDLTQGFFAHLLARDFLKGLARDQGRFRAFLLASLRHYLSDQRDKACALKRGGGEWTLSFDQADAEERYRREPTDFQTPDRIYERRWALPLLEQALARLRDEFAAAGKMALFDVLRQFQGDEPSPTSGAEAAAFLGIPESTFKSHLHRFRRRYRELICEEVAQTVASPADIADELRHLKSVLSQP